MLARAKLNLFLHVGAVQSNGYHPIFSLVTFAACGDKLICGVSDELTLSINGPYAGDLTQQPLRDNLIMQAAYTLKDWAQKQGISVSGAHMQLEKNLPIASGIGGGSADAAAALQMLTQEWQLSAPDDVLADLALALGADVPVCLAGKASYISGVGEQLRAVTLPDDVHVLLVNPGVVVSTAEVFSEFDRLGSSQDLEPQSFPTHIESRDSLIHFLESTRNDLQESAIHIAPSIGEVLEELAAHGASFSRMSGSGATCFGFFGSEEEAHSCFEKIALKRPNWWVCATKLSHEVGQL